MARPVYRRHGEGCSTMLTRDSQKQEMANAEVVAFNSAAFLSALFLLEYGADKFVDHSAIVATRIGVSQAVVALLTAGAEWEELGVVVASLARSRSSLALGNIIGSAISNILGAFSLGLITRSTTEPVSFDRSSRIYSLLLLLVATFATPLVYFAQKDVWKIGGGTLIGIFTVYVASIVWAISRGKITAPEGSDDEDSSDGEGDSGEERPLLQPGNLPSDRSPSPTSRSRANGSHSPEQRPVAGGRRASHSLTYHVMYLVLGFLAISLAAYIISNAATNITDQLGIGDMLFGVVVLAVATTLPEKFIAVFSGLRGHMGILVANTAGSNIFLLTLCLGIIMLVSEGRLDADSINIVELAVLWVSTLAFTATVWFGGRWTRWVGVLMLVAYVAFLVLEFAVIRRG